MLQLELQPGAQEVQPALQQAKRSLDRPQHLHMKRDGKVKWGQQVSEPCSRTTTPRLELQPGAQGVQPAERRAGQSLGRPLHLLVDPDTW